MMVVRRAMEFGYKAAVRLSDAYRLDHYNLGLAESRHDAIQPSQARLVDRLVADTPIEDSVLVDIGSGAGGALFQLASRHHPRTAIGIDLCWPNIKAAARRRAADNAENGITFVQADAQCLPMASGSVDVLFNLESAFHYPNKDRFVAECARVLRPGGTLLIGDLVQHRWIPRVVSMTQAAWFWREQRYRTALSTAGFTLASSEDVTPLVINSIRGALRQIGRERIGRWWSASQSILGIWGAGVLLKHRWLRYMLFRARRD